MILPSPSAATAAYWQAASAGRLILRHCPGCGAWRHPRVTRCCAASTLEWKEASCRGTLVSYAIVRRALSPAMENQVPYTITLTRTEEGPQLVTSLPGAARRLRIGAPMRVVFDRLTDSIGLPRFTPVGQDA